MSQNDNQQGPWAGQYTRGAAPGGYLGQGQAQGMGPAQPGMPHHLAYQPYQQPSGSLLNMPNDRFLKGMLIGVAATYLLTNEQVQRTAIKGVVKAWSLFQGGIEEVKEKFGDAAAELHHSSQEKGG
ncbi:hypothetical protein [Thiorhodococcus minor]|uniref:YtxH domain-containing protein n=1 Tax=Thiorhodococcus minor TaxID=57489 RepID=A0A6M0JZB8_9GAMM|nr:hypothetical protein [Thiorhodococcus minor]NEV62499.1 hypothetical protein [Thiorhodococcus minor]